MTPARPLDWYAKQFGPGDLDGVGARRLLGTPSLEPFELLVRETAQNSWDARAADTGVIFDINVRSLTRSQMDTLRSHVLAEYSEKTEITGLLSRQSLSVVEISDRGTVGLGGPVRNDLAVGNSETNFIDFVFNIGSPRDGDLGGGTYGFGKTIAYALSEVGTVIIWSRCRAGRGELEHRLIASAIGDPYNEEALRYTGRHWWGRRTDDDRIEPVIGNEAEAIGRQLFDRRFDGQERGTSILILAPKLDGDHRETACSIAKHAIANLWPKMVPEAGQPRAMQISVRHDGEHILFPTLEEDDRLRGRVKCLRAVRAAQRGEDGTKVDPLFAIEVHEIRSERPKALLGHLALMRIPSSDSQQSSITLMRHKAELVVKELKPSSFKSTEPGFTLAGVFKPRREFDDSFAESEPPAHDDWVPTGINDRIRQRHVRIALNRIGQYADAFASPTAPRAGEDGERQSAAFVGDALAGLLTGEPGSGPTPRIRRTSNTGRASRKPKETVSIVGHGEADESRSGWLERWVEVKSGGSSAESKSLRASVSLAFEGGSESGGDDVSSIGWQVGTSPLTSDETVSLYGGATARFYFQVRGNRTVIVDVDQEDSS